MTYRNDPLRDNYHDVDRFTKQIAEYLDDPKQIVLSFSDATAATGSAAWKPGRKVEVLAIRAVNSDVLVDTATTTTAFDIDIEDGAGNKTHDLVAKADTVAIVADAIHDFVMPIPADKTVEATEQIKVVRTIVGAQGEISLVFDYNFID